MEKNLTTGSIGQSVGAGNRRQAARDIGNTVTLFMVAGRSAAGGKRGIPGSVSAGGVVV